MGISIFLNEHKKIYIQNTSSIYKTENNFDNLQIYIPLIYNNIPTEEYTILLNIVNADNEGDVITLSNPAIERDRYYKYETPIQSSWTYKAGKIGLWLKLLKDGDVVGLTNEVFLNINNSREIDNYIPEQQLSLLNEWTLKMNGIQQEIDENIGMLEEINLHPPHVGETGDWYIWDCNRKEYVDSNIKFDFGCSVQIKDDYWILLGKES